VPRARARRPPRAPRRRRGPRRRAAAAAHCELKIGSYFSQPASRIRACRQIPVHARQPAARLRAQQACMQANPSACTGL
jgi:hypothetical protein